MRSPTWVTMGPPPHLATCERCGRTLPMIPLPIGLKTLAGYCKGFEAEHRECKERKS